MTFIVRETTEQEGLKIVQIEPMRGIFLLDDEVPLGCIQHIISSLMRYGKESKEICDKMCRILCNIHMDDCSFCI